MKKMEADRVVEGVEAILLSILDVVMGIVAFLVGLRFLFRLAAANPATPFVAWIYQASAAIMTPFAGIFPNQSLGSGAVLDSTAFVSLLFYALIFYLLRAAVKSIKFDSRPAHWHATP
ncbi:YggT family protein [Candidatus Microgenomates bacterium]|nr:YggT family protein [Candidatus Microgenomates bacterium]